MGLINSFPGGNGGSEITVDAALDATSENPVQNKVINTELAKKIAYTPQSTTSAPANTDVIELVEPSSGNNFFLKAITWSNIKASLKTYFDTLYSTVKTRGTPTSGGTALSLVTTGDMYNWNNPSIPVVANQFDKANIYSTTEKIVGCWTDGRPVYQKTIIKSIGNGNITITLKDEIANIGNLIDEVLLGKNSGVDHYETTPIKQTGVSDTKISYVKTGVSPQFPTDPTKYIVTCNWSGTGHSVALIIKYTKTTDSANSFKYADENDYSTTEHIVGSWIDGKPVYQRTLYAATLTKSNNILQGNFPNTKDIIKISVGALISKTQSGTTYKILFPQNKVINADDETPGAGKLNYWCQTTQTKTTNNIGMYVDPSDNNTYYECKITVQYTKTTD